MRRLLFALGFFLAFTAQVLGAIGTPTTLGSNNTGTSAASLTITTTGAIVAGNLVVVAIYVIGTNPTVTSVSDGTNSYTRANNSLSGTGTGELWYKENASAVGSSASLTVNFGGTITTSTIAAAQVSGIASSSSYDSAAAAAATGTSTTPSATTGTLAQAEEIVFGVVTVGSTSTLTESAGFTNLYSLSNGAAVKLGLGYDIVAATTAVTYHPTLGSSVIWRALATPFKAPSTQKQFMLMGVGP